MNSSPVSRLLPLVVGGGALVCGWVVYALGFGRGLRSGVKHCSSGKTVDLAEKQTHSPG